jgi:hypothetical protein
MLKKINLKSPWLAPVIFLLVANLRLWPFFAGQTLAMFDNYSLMMPIKLFQAGWIREGIIPLWNPLLFSGISLVGDINQSLFYPSTLFFVIFKPVLALNFILLIHLALTGLGMFYLAKIFVKHNHLALLAGVMWLLSAQVTNSLNNLSLIQSLAWTPWIMWLGLLLVRNAKANWWLPIIMTLQLLGGYPQHVLYTVLGTLFLSLVLKPKSDWKKLIIIWLGVGLKFIFLSAFVWLPFLETLLHSTRMTQSQAQSVSGSLHPIELIKLIIPSFFDQLQLGLRWGPKWNESPYLAWYVGWLGLLTPALVLFSKKRTSRDWWLASSVLFTLWFSLGEYAPGFSLLQKIVPIFRISRIPTTILGIGTIFIILWLVTSLPRLKIHQQFFKLLIGGGILVVLAASWQLQHGLTNNDLIASSFHTLERDALIAQSIAQSLLISSLLFVLALWMWQKKKWSLLILFLTVDVFIQTQNLLLFAPANVYPATLKVNTREVLPDFNISFQERILTRNLNQPYTGFAAYWDAVSVRPPFSDSYVSQPDFSHLNRFRQGLTPDWNLMSGVPIVNGYSTLLPQDYVEIWTDKSVINQLPSLEINHQQLATWAVKYYLVDNWFEVKEDLSAYPVVAKNDSWQLHELPALPRFRFENDDPAELEKFSENPNVVEFSLDNASNHQQLIVADRYDKNWQAEVNGEKVELENYQGMRKIDIQPGENEIKLHYLPRLFSWGLGILVTTVFYGSIRILTRRK